MQIILPLTKYKAVAENGMDDAVGYKLQCLLSAYILQIGQSSTGICYLLLLPNRILIRRLISVPEFLFPYSNGQIGTVSFPHACNHIHLHAFG